MAAIAPMEVPGPAANIIPLKCLICPKKPNFSDLSHLLTHIASKSHLAEKFRVSLRPDPESKADTAAYLEWEDRYAINELMAERLASKEKKTTSRKRTRNSTSTRSDSGNTRSGSGNTRSSSGCNPNTFQRRDRPADDGTALIVDSIKAEPDEFMQAQVGYGAWSSISRRQGYFDNSNLQTPTASRSRGSLALPSTPQQHSMILRSRRFPSESTAVSGKTSEFQSEITEISEDANDGDHATKLKGVVYEGMGLFDSATTPQKKKRNQRKDASVLEKMEQTSREITSLETVYELTQEGLKPLRYRDVYDSPSIDGSPDEADNSKKKRARRTLTVAASSQVRRSSTRLTRKMTASRNNALKAERLDEEEEDAEADADTTDHSGVFTHGHASVDAYDVFTDGPKPIMQHTWMDWSMPTSGNNQMTAGRHESPMDDSAYDSRRSSALRSMSTNNPSDTVRAHSYFPTRDAGASSFTSQPSVPANPYYHHSHGLSSAGSYNPLCAQPRPAFYSYGYTGYPATEIKPQPGFQAVSMTQNLGNLSYGSFGQYPTDQHDRVGQDFDL